MTLIEAAKQALEALENLQGICSEEGNFIEQLTIWTPEAMYALRTAIAEAEKQEPLGYWNAVEGWVELPEEAHKPKWPLKHQWVNGRGYVVWRDVFEGNMKCPLDEAIAAHAQAVFVDEGDAKEYCAFKNTTPLAQPAQEPSSWVETVAVNLVREGINKHKARELAAHFHGLAHQPAAQQEPVAWMDASQTTLSWENYLDGMKPLYTTPPAAQWVGLTDEQINQYDYQYRDILYDVEKMLRENNA